MASTAVWMVPWAVRRMTAVLETSWPSAANLASSPRPSSRGIFKSVTTMAGFQARAFSHPSMPSCAVSVRYPQAEISSARPMRAWGSSSTIRTLTPEVICSFDAAGCRSPYCLLPHARRGIFPSGWLAFLTSSAYLVTSHLPCFFRQFRPACVKGIGFPACLIELGQGLLKGRCIGGDGRIFHPLPGYREPRVRLLHPLLDGGELARFQVGEFFLGRRSAPRFRSTIRRRALL